MNNADLRDIRINNMCIILMITSYESDPRVNLKLIAYKYNKKEQKANASEQFVQLQLW